MIDCQFAGISGDKFVAALIDLGASAKQVIGIMKRSKDYVQGCRYLDVIVKQELRGGFNAKVLYLKSSENVQERKGEEIVNAVSACVKDSRLSRDARKFAHRTVQTLVNTEAILHGVPAKEVHLHEAGSVDTIADIVGAAAALDELDLWKNTSFYTTPIAVGCGLFKFSHGILSSPAFATMEILRKRGLMIIDGPVESELATPTGASMLASLTDEYCTQYPPFKPISIGYGAGQKELEGTPNILRIVIGESYLPQETDEISIVETNLDDVSGEVIGYTMNRLIENGALDVCVIPIFTKKNRPGSIIRMIVERVKMAEMIDILTEETGTMGVRILNCQRHIVNRKLENVDFKLNGVRVQIRGKTSKDRFGNVIRIKPEYDDVSKLARKLNIPFRKILEEFYRQIP